MTDRRNLALLLVAVCSVALAPTVMPQRNTLDALAPITPLASPDFPRQESGLDALHDEARAALLALRTHR